MDILDDALLLEQQLCRYSIPAMFQTEGLHFRLFRYRKGEFLSEPSRALGELLFLVQGSVSIYAIRENAETAPVSLLKPLSILGDTEFCRRGGVLYAQAKTTVLCVSLSLSVYRPALLRDAAFLYTLLQSMESKLYLCAQMDVPSIPLRERVLAYLHQFSPDGTLCGIDAATHQLHCSRRQLQRVLHTLCAEGRLQKTGKGCYALKEKEEPCVF